MAFHAVRFPLDIALGARGGPERKTDIVTLASGAEERNSRWAQSRRRYNAGYGVKSRADMQAVLAFFEERRGRLHGFLWRDGLDHSSGGAVPLPTDQRIGTGDGVRLGFQLSKTYGVSFDPYKRGISKPVAGSVRVAVGGVERLSGWNVDVLTGIVGFTTPPAAGAAVTAGFLFDVPVRFDIDRLDIELTSFDGAEVPSIPLLEILAWKALQAGYAAHMASGQTTTALCWRIRRSDGWVRGFTEHDQVLRFDGTVFDPAHGLDGSEAPRKLGPQVDTGEVLGVLHAEAIGEDDIALGRFDGASVETFRVNWRDVGQRDLLRRDSIGEIVRQDGVFRAELRSGQQALNVVKGRVYQSLCDAVLGDGKCGVGLDNPAYRGFAVVETVLDRFRLGLSGIEGFAPGWFGFGQVRWTDGRRLGLRDPVLAHRRVGMQDVLEFEQPVGEWVAAGDGLTVYAGCDRRLATCRDKFANTLNFRGFPHIPGNDYVLRHPRHGDALDGRAVVR